MKRLWIAAAITAAVLVAGAGSVNARQEHPTPTQTYVVKSGDTLWTIAERLGIEGDRRRAVQIIRDLNELSSASLRPGQRLELPL